MEFILYAVGTPYAMEAFEILLRQNASVRASVSNITGSTIPKGLPNVIEKQEISPELLIIATLIPLLTPGHRFSALSEAESLGFTNFPTVIDPTAIIAGSAQLSEGCLVNAGVIIGAHSQIGRFTSVNRGASIGHDIITEPFVTIGPSAVISGSCRIEQGAFIGSGAILAPGCSIGHNAIVGAGSVVVKDIPAHTVAVGNPARIIRKHTPGYNGVSV